MSANGSETAGPTALARCTTRMAARTRANGWLICGRGGARWSTATAPPSPTWSGAARRCTGGTPTRMCRWRRPSSAIASREIGWPTSGVTGSASWSLRTAGCTRAAGVPAKCTAKGASSQPTARPCTWASSATAKRWARAGRCTRCTPTPRRRRSRWRGRGASRAWKPASVCCRRPPRRFSSKRRSRRRARGRSRWTTRRACRSSTRLSRRREPPRATRRRERWATRQATENRPAWRSRSLLRKPVS